MVIRKGGNRCAFIIFNLLSPTLRWIKFSHPIKIRGRECRRYLMSLVKPLTLFLFFPAAAKAEATEEVKTVSGKVDAEKGEKKTKDGKKEGKSAKEGKGDEKDTSTKKKGEKGEKGASKKEDGDGKGKKPGEKGDKGEKGAKGGAKGGGKKAQK